MFEDKRQKMVELQLAARGIKILDPFLEVPRHLFVPENMQNYAYEDSPLPIGKNQTISQPYIVAFMTQAAELSPNDRVLEIGTGSGYQAAILSRLAGQVYSVERIPELSLQAESVLKSLGYGNIHLKVDDGTLGWQEESPFDVIIVTAGAPAAPPALIGQLKIGGRLIIPVGGSHFQTLIRIKKVSETEITTEELESVRFVPLIGQEGWDI